MKSEDRFWVIIVLSVLLTIGATIVLVNESYTRRVKTAIENGYCESTVVGNSAFAWTKCGR
jgi:hypothetical protein